MTAVGERLVAAVAGYRLDGADLRLPSSPLEDQDWHAMLEMVGANRLAGLLCWAVSDGAFAVSPAQGAEASRLRLLEAACNVRLVRALLQVREALASADLDFRVLKGPALAHTIYPKASVRSFVDIDLLVRSDAFDRAIDVLTGLGATRNPEPRPGFSRRFAKSVTLTMPKQESIDLHRTIAPGHYGLTIDLTTLFASRTPFVIDDQQMLGLGPEERFLHACYHAVLNGPPRLVPLRDVVQTATAKDFDQARATRLATAWRADVVVAGAVRIAWKTFAMREQTSLSKWATNYEATAAERRLVETFQGANHSERLMIRAIPGWRDRFGYIGARLFPSRVYLRSLGHGYVDHAARGLRRLVRSS
jgi:hypothetical protein